MTELQISLLTDFTQNCAQNSKVVWTNKHVENPNTNRLPKILCMTARGWYLERLPLLENLQSLHCLMYKFGNSSPHSYLNNSVTYRGEKKRVSNIKSDFILLNFCLKLSFSSKLNARCGSHNVNVIFSLQPYFWRIMCLSSVAGKEWPLTLSLTNPYNEKSMNVGSDDIVSHSTE